MEIRGIPLAGEKKGVSFPTYYPNPASPKAPTASSPAHQPCLPARAGFLGAASAAIFRQRQFGHRSLQNGGRKPGLPSTVPVSSLPEAQLHALVVGLFGAPRSPEFPQVLHSQHLMQPHPNPGLRRLPLIPLYNWGNQGWVEAQLARKWLLTCKSLLVFLHPRSMTAQLR